MMTFIVQLVLAAWLVLFAALALFPLFLRDQREQPRESNVPVEDRVISVVPSAIAHRLRAHHLPVAADHPRGSDHRRAA